ncbi:hypothetical protein CSA37_08350 [Candidatus Fermentibacteria bacterium]|nr:MAG: hypothetical protein CSA37_08350 [Candidatus Fermentibacteria bacterium]
MMIMILLLAASPAQTPLLDIYNQVVQLTSENLYEEAFPLVNNIAERMPDNERAGYNAATAIMLQGDFSTADSLLSLIPQGSIGEDTLTEALSSARLGNSMAAGDYNGVQSVVEMVEPWVTQGTATERMLQNREVAIKWLRQNEPPPDQDQQNQDDQENQEDQEDQENQEDQDDQQDQEDQEDQEDQNNQQDQEDQENQEEESEEQPPPPSNPEMTPEIAQTILDMVEEAEADTASVSSGGAMGAPIW